MSLHFHPLRLRAKHQDTDDAVVLCFDVPEALQDTFRFTQGQYLTLRGDVGGQDLRRSYSICAGVDDKELRVGVRHVDGGAFSTWVHQHLQPGDEIQVFPPQGRFHVPVDPSAARHYLGIAAGSGITPILSIMKTVLAREPDSRFTLIYGNRRPASAMFKEELEDLKNRYLTRLSLYHVFSREHVDSPLMSGRLDQAKLADFLRTLVPAASVDQVFVCGPFEMNEQAEAALRGAGIPEDRIHIERFGTPEMQQGRPAPHETQAS
ncbi:MAG: FAD-binding oxidoreductase, partial [Burkholderiaceae bacterium]